MTGLQALTMGGALLAAVSAGTTYAFSSFVMPALDRLPEAVAIESMQQINRSAISGAFLGVFIGTAPMMIILASAHSLSTSGDSRMWLPSLVYGLGVVGVTVAGNVPLNDWLDTVSAASAPAGTWERYSITWTRLNHVRTTMAAVTSLLAMAMIVRP